MPTALALAIAKYNKMNRVAHCQHESQCSAAQLKDAGFSAHELMHAGFDFTTLKDIGFTPAQLKAAGFRASEFKLAGNDLGQLKAVHCWLYCEGIERSRL